MTLLKRVIRNVTANWIASFADIAVGFVLMPFLANNLGDNIYGIWILIGSLTGFFRMTDFGLRSAISRFVAYHIGTGDEDGLRNMVKSGTTALAVLSVLAVIFSAILAASLHWLVPAKTMVHGIRLSLFLVGCTMATAFLGSAYAGILRGFHRFDLVRIIDVLRSGIRLALAIYLIKQGGGLIALASLSLGLSTSAILIQYCMVLKFCPVKRIFSGSFSKTELKKLLTYGWWNFLGMNARNAQHITVNLLIVNFSGFGAEGITLISIPPNDLRISANF